MPVDEANIISLKLFPRMLPAREVHDFEVPIALRDLAMLIRNEGTLFYLLIFITPL